MSDTLRSLYDNLHNSWNNYTILLNEAELMLKEKQEEFHDMVLNDQEIFKQNIEDFKKIWEEFKETESKNVELTSSGSYNTLLSKLVFYQIVIFVKYLHLSYIIYHVFNHMSLY